MGARAGLRHARKHLAAYADERGRGRALRRALVTTEDAAAEAFALLARAFEARAIGPRHDDRETAAPSAPREAAGPGRGC